MARTGIVVAASALGVLVGLFSLALARDDPAYSFAGESTVRGIALLGAGWAVIGSGLWFSLRRPASRFGPVLVAAGLAWFLLEWNNPGIGSPLAFTTGLVLYAACPPLAAHALLAYPGGRLSSPYERGAVAIAYVGSLLVLGILPALFFDPRAQGCGQCPRNLLQLASDAERVADLERFGVRVGLAWTLAAAVLLVLKLVRGSRAARRSGGAVSLAGIAYLGLVAATFGAALDRGFLANGTLERRLWLGQAAALLAIALGVGWSWLRARQARAEVARLVVELAESAPPGGLQDVLARIVRDPELVLAYPLADSGRLVDARGRPVEIDDRRERTSLVRDGRPVAVLAHAPGRLDDEQLVDEVTAAARLALENERLQAEVRARLEELRASRARIVEAGDAERKRLERDLHDGAQQRLVGLSLSLRLLRSRVHAEASAEMAARLDEADSELRTAITELRELAHGIFPAVLADEGLAAAIEALAEDAAVPMRIDAVPEERFAASVETAAYTLVAETARAATSPLVLCAGRLGGSLSVTLETDLDERFDLVALEDRVGALGGRLALERGANGRVTISAELPCGS